MVNTEDFIKRLEIILDYYTVSASAFADSIGVQRSALSHLMSGRNKPSLDLIMKIVESYPEVDLYWLLNGKGNFPKDNPASVIKNAAPAPTPMPVSDLFSASEIDEQENNIPLQHNEEEPGNSNYNKIFTGDIEQIVVFYKDGTFKKYRPQ